MSVNKRVQEQLRAPVANAGGGATTLVAIPRPKEAEPFAGSDFEGGKVNHLVEQEIGRREGMAGLVGLTPTGTILAADVFVERLFRRRLGEPFRDAGPALFPSGAEGIPSDEKPLIADAVGTTDASRALNDTEFLAFISKLTISADEELVLQIRKDAAGAVAGEIVARYDLGAHEGDVGKEALF